MYEDASDGGSEGEGHNHPPTWKMELKGGPAMASGLGLPQNQIMDIGAWGLSLAPRPSILGTRLVGGVAKIFGLVNQSAYCLCQGVH